jgi:hypothetical protein
LCNEGQAAMAEPLFLMWYDDNPKIASAKKIEAAIDVYTERFRVRPNLLWINTDEVLDYPGMQVRGMSTIARNNYWVGYERPDQKHGSTEGRESHGTEGTEVVAGVNAVLPQGAPPKVRRPASPRKRASAA